MKNKYHFFIKIAINLVGIIGLYGVIYDLLCNGLNCFLPKFLIPPNMYVYSMIYGLPITALYMILKKKRLDKIIGVVYLFGFLSVLYLIGEALT